MTIVRPGQDLRADHTDEVGVVRCGIIGLGKMGRIRAAAIAEAGGGRIDMVFDPDESHAHEYRVAGSAEELIAQDELDAVFICTPNVLNKPLTIMALQAGKHVFCEKPPAFTAQDVEEIIEVERGSGCCLMYGFNHRHHQSIRTAKELIDSGEFGRLLWMRGRYGKSVDKSFFDTWRSDRSMAGGGILLDQGIHMLDLLLYFAGDFHETQAMVSDLYWDLPGIEDNVFANFRNTQTGVVASLHSTMTQWRHLFSLEIFLSGGHIVLNGLKTSSNAYGEEVLTVERNSQASGAVSWEEPRRIAYDVDTSWASEVKHFLDCIRDHRSIEEGTSGDALKVMRLIGRVYDYSH